MNYYNFINDEYGFVHSIDMVTYTYKLLVSDLSLVRDELEHIAKENDVEIWGKYDLLPTSRYNFFSNNIHINNIFISYGQYIRRAEKDWVKSNVLMIRLNPNKRLHDKITKDILSWIRQRCVDGHLHMYDYAIDVPYHIKSVQVINSRKEKGLYKGSKTYGQRSHHGFLKIYDKAKEQHLDYTLTRVEHTLDASKTLSLEEVIIADADDITTDLSELDEVNKAIVNMALALKSADIDYEVFLENLNYRRRTKIYPYLEGNGKKIEYSTQIIQSLLNRLNEVFNATRDSSYGKETERTKAIIGKREMERINDVAQYLELDDLRPHDEDEATTEQYYKYICDIEASDRQSEMVWSYKYERVMFRWKYSEKKEDILKVKNILKKEYDKYQLIDVTYNENTPPSSYRTFRVLDKYNNVVIQYCHLHHLKKFLKQEEQEDAV